MGRPSKYPAEFRQEAVRLALVSDESRAAVARRLGINETTLRNWVAGHLAEEARGSDPLAIAVSEREELRQLRKEVDELRTEREILRKAAAYFAQETIRSAASGSSTTGSGGPNGQRYRNFAVINSLVGYRVSTCAWSFRSSCSRALRCSRNSRASSRYRAGAPTGSMAIDRRRFSTSSGIGRSATAGG